MSHYTIETIEPREIRIRQNTSMWHIGYDSYDTTFSNPVSPVFQNEVKTVNAIAHHTIGYDFYLLDPASTDGYNVLDTEPNDPIPEVETPRPTIQAPVTAPNKEPYVVVKELQGWLTPGLVGTDKFHVTIIAGNYYIYNRMNMLINVTRELGQPGWWINELENVPDPEPVLLPEKRPLSEPWPNPVEGAGIVEPEQELLKDNWRTSYIKLKDVVTGDEEPVMYVAIRDTPVANLEGRFKDSKLPNGDMILISGLLCYGGRIYGRSAIAAARGRYDSVLLQDLDVYVNIYGIETDPQSRVAFGTATRRDHIALVLGHIESWLDKRKRKGSK